MDPEKKDVIIVGGGLAGLSAAAYLEEKEFKISVLEMESRLGGRVRTEQMEDGLKVELGGEWIAPDHFNIKSFCHQFSLRLVSHRLNPLLKTGPHKFIEDGFASAYNGRLSRLLRAGTRQLTSDEERERLATISWQDYLKDIGLDRDELEVQRLLGRFSYGRDISGLSALNAISDLQGGIADEDTFWIEGGNDQLVEKLAEAVGKNNIRLNSKVLAIKQNGHIEVVTEDQTFQADIVLVTLPPNALREIDFVPSMPAKKMAALRDIDFAAITKVALLYPRRFWQDEAFGLLQAGIPDAIYHATKGQIRQMGILTAYGVSWNAGELAKMDDDQKEILVSKALAAKFSCIPYYYDIKTAFWDKAYSVYRFGQFHAIRNELVAPWINVYFAGEHIPKDFRVQGYMEGAVSSGLEVAKQIASIRASQ